MSKIKTEVISIDPATAMGMLRRNKNNRPISQRVVKKYASAMRNGRWIVNGETIIISDTNKLIDGQHRLNAIIESGSTISMVVVSGVKDSAFSTIDIGKKRSGADALATFDEKFLKNRAALAAAIVNISQFTENGVWIFNRSKETISNDIIIERVKAFKGLERSIEFVQTLRGARKLVPLSALAALHYLFSKKDMDDAERFFHKLNTGEKLESGDPILFLRSKLVDMNTSGGVLRTREVIPVLVKAWELTRRGEKGVKIRIDKDYVPTII